MNKSPENENKTERRRDEALKQMLKTPPKPHKGAKETERSGRRQPLKKKD